MKRMTYDEFDILCEEVTKYNFLPNNWLPTLDEIEKYIYLNPKKYIDFILWILENNDLPKTEEDKKIVKKLNKIIKENISFKE